MKFILPYYYYYYYYYYYHYYYTITIISNSNWTKWSTIQRVIVWVISKSDKHEVRGRFEITSMITPWIVRYDVQLLINRIYNKLWN